MINRVRTEFHAGAPHFRNLPPRQTLAVFKFFPVRTDETGGDIHGGGKSVFLQRRKSRRVEIPKAIVEGDRDWFSGGAS